MKYYQVSHKKEDEYEVWHRCLGHVGPTVMEKSANIIRGIKLPALNEYNDYFCEPYVTDK